MAYTQSSFGQPSANTVSMFQQPSGVPYANSQYGVFGAQNISVTIPNEHPYNTGALSDGTPVVKQGHVYIMFNPERPYNAPNKVFWKVMGDGTRNIKDQLKAEVTGIRWNSTQKYWGLATSADPQDFEFARLARFVYRVSTQPLPQLPTYGAPQPAPGSFGAPQPAPGSFGAPQPAPGSFGAPQPAPGSFGAPQPAPGSFGAPQPAPGSFGAPQPASPVSSWYHGMITPTTNNSVYVTYKVPPCPSVGDEVVVADISAVPQREVKFVVTDRTVSHYNSNFFDTFTAKSVWSTSDISMIFKIINGFWAPMTPYPDRLKIISIHAAPTQVPADVDPFAPPPPSTMPVPASPRSPQPLVVNGEQFETK